MPSQERVRRLLSIIEALQTGQPVTSKTLSDQSGVTRRTIFRDIKMLQDAGLEVEFDDRKQSYRFRDSKYLLPIDLTVDEVLSLMILCQDVADSEFGIPLHPGARTAAFKLLSMLPRGMRQYVGEVIDLHRVQLDARNRFADSHGYYDMLRNAIDQRHQVRMTYQSLMPDEDIIETDFSPYRLMFHRRSWYAIGYSSLHQEVRTFNIYRIQALQKLDQSFEIPTSFSLDDYFGNAWSMIRDSSQQAHVVIKFSAMVAKNVSEIQWHRTQRIEQCEDGGIEYHADLEGLNEIVWWILGYGSHAQVLAPPELQEMVKEHARQLVALYENS